MATGSRRWRDRLAAAPSTARDRLHGIVLDAAPRGTTRGRILETIRDARSHHPKSTRPGQDLRILIVGPPKTGNVWIKCLLARVYGLRWIDYGGPDERSLASLDRFIQRGGFQEGTIFHRHYPYSPELLTIIQTIPCQLVTMIRDPYDLFVSSYYHVQGRPARFVQGKGQLHRIVGKPLDHPDVLHYLEHGFGRVLDQATGWAGSGASIVVRYEDLHRDPVAEVSRVTHLIRPASDAEIDAAVGDCSAETMRRMNRQLSKHVRTATVGDSKQRLGPAHITIFRERYSDVIRALGYEVR